VPATAPACRVHSPVPWSLKSARAAYPRRALRAVHRSVRSQRLRPLPLRQASGQRRTSVRPRTSARDRVAPPGKPAPPWVCLRLKRKPGAMPCSRLVLARPKSSNALPPRKRAVSRKTPAAARCARKPPGSRKSAAAPAKRLPKLQRQKRLLRKLKQPRLPHLRPSLLNLPLP